MKTPILGLALLATVGIGFAHPANNDCSRDTLCSDPSNLEVLPIGKRSFTYEVVGREGEYFFFRTVCDKKVHECLNDKTRSPSFAQPAEKRKDCSKNRVCTGYEDHDALKKGKRCFTTILSDRTYEYIFFKTLCDKIVHDCENNQIRSPIYGETDLDHKQCSELEEEAESLQNVNVLIHKSEPLQETDDTTTDP